EIHCDGSADTIAIAQDPENRSRPRFAFPDQMEESNNRSRPRFAFPDQMEESNAIRMSLQACHARLTRRNLRRSPDNFAHRPTVSQLLKPAFRAGTELGGVRDCARPCRQGHGGSI